MEPAAGSPWTGLSQESARAPTRCERSDFPVGFSRGRAGSPPSAGNRGRQVAFRVGGCALPFKAGGVGGSSEVAFLGSREIMIGLMSMTRLPDATATV
ncbi:hypothetical protein STEG23_035327 [Scotinomys teguina]